MAVLSHQNHPLRRLESKDNDTVKRLCALQTNRKKRTEAGLFIAEGLRLCEDARRSGIGIEAAFFTEDFIAAHPEWPDSLGGEVQLCCVSRAVFEKVSDTKAPQGVLCLCRMPKHSLSVKELSLTGHYLALESVRDPGNLGTVLRSAEAMGADGVLLSADCVDVYSPKTLRSAMGAVFRLPVAICGDLAEDIVSLRSRGLACYASVVSPDAAPITGLDFSGGGLIVVGNEARGVSEEMRAACGASLTIPMRGRAESLNAAAAAALLLWELCGR